MGKNPCQDPFVNLGAEAVTRGVGGMTTHWTCATPELSRDTERPKLSTDAAEDESIWKDLYAQAKGIIGTSTHIAFRTYSRHDLDAAFSLGLDG